MRIIRLNKVSSTNEFCKLLIEARLNWEWDIVIASEQYAGYGKDRRLWFSPSGGIYMSLIIQGGLKSSMVSPAIGVAVAKALGENILLKWPNDIVYDGKKLGGILVEEFSGWLILGIGINTFDKRLLDEIPLPNAIALKLNDDEKERLIRKIIKNVQVTVGMLRRSNFEPIVREWNRRAFMSGREIKVHHNGVVYVGILEGISSSGYLTLKMDGESVEISDGEIDPEIYLYAR